MEIQLIRHVTMKIWYAGKIFLADPMLSPKGANMSIVAKEWNPTVELRVRQEDVVSGVNAVMISHVHPDHFDATAAEQLAKRTTVFCQPGEETTIRKKGFPNIIPVEDSYEWESTTITRTPATHGNSWISRITGVASGFVLQAPTEPTLYWVGDSVYSDEVKDVISRFKPQVIVTHSGGNQFPFFKDPIVMDVEQTIELAKDAEKSVVLPIGMEALDHCPVKRKNLVTEARNAGVDMERFVVLTDGNSIKFPAKSRA